MSDINVTVQDEIVNIDVIDTPVLVEVTNSPGPAGAGVAVGGTTGQVLAKASNTNYDTVWVNPSTGGVPYSGATGNVNLGEYELKAGQVTLDTSPTGTAAVGTIRWNDSTGTSETTLKGGNVIIKNGVDLVARVVNKVSPNTTLTKAAYQAVRISGAQGQRLAVALAQANNDTNSADTIGLVTETIATNQEGFIMTMGQLENINTTGSLQGETWVDGDVLYLSPTTAGALTNIKPTGAGHIVVIGYVEYAHVNNGKIYTKVMNGWELDELHDVDIISPANNEALIYESSTSLWKNKTIATALGFTPVPTSRTITINGVTFDLSADRSYTVAAGISGSGASGQVTYWTGASAVAGSNNLFWDNANGRLGIGTNAPSATLTVAGGITLSSGSLSLPVAIHSVFGGSYRFWNRGSNRWTFEALNANIGFEFKHIMTSGNAFHIVNTSDTSQFLVTGDGNVGIGVTPTVRLQVSGDTLLRGSGATSATTALTVQNSSSTNLFRIANDGFVYGGYVNYVGQNSTNPLTFSFVDGAFTSPGAAGRNFGYFNSNTTQTGDQYHFALSGNTITATSGTHVGIYYSRTFAPTSGSGIFSATNISPIINQTGGANGITRGLYVNPTLTAAADFRAIETTAGNVLFGSNFFWDNTNGRLGIGTNAPANALHVVGNIAGFGATPLVALVPSGWGGQSLLIQSGVTQTGTTTGNYSIFKHDGASRGWAFAQGSTVCMQIAPAGNVSIGTNADLGVRLGVVGDTLLRGSGATSATTALTVQNSSSTNLFTVRNDGNVGINNSSPGYRLDVNGTSRFENYMLLSRANSTAAILTIQNVTSGTAQVASLDFIPNSGAGAGSIGKSSSAYSPFKIITASNLYIYNPTAGDISILNDVATGTIKMAAGASSTSHLTIKANGTINMSSLPTSSTGLVAGDLWNDAGTIKIV